MSFKYIYFYNISDCPIYGELFTAQWVDPVAPSVGMCILSTGEFPLRESERAVRPFVSEDHFGFYLKDVYKRQHL